MVDKVALDISALNPSFKEHAKRGIGRYVRELYKALKEEKEKFLLTTFDQCELLSPIQKKIISKLPCGKQSISQQIFIPHKLKKCVKDVVFTHFPAHTDVPLFAPKPYMVTVLDLIYLRCKNLYDQGNYRARFARALEMASIKRADKIIAISKCTADDVHELLKIPYEKIRVTPLGVDESFFNIKLNRDYEESFRKEYNLTNNTKIILYVGGIDQRKNYPILLKTIKCLREQYREKSVKQDFRLVMVGQIKQDRQYPIFKKLEKEYGVEDLVIETGYLEDNNLKSLYKFADVLFFPTLYEGFGLTPLEAMASKLPVVASNTPAVFELLEGVALLKPAMDYAKFASDIDLMFSDEEVRREYIENGFKRAKRYTWDNTCKTTINAYEEMFKLKK